MTGPRSETLRGRISRRFESLPVFFSALVLLALVIRLGVVFAVVYDGSHTGKDASFGWESWEMGWTARSLFMGKGFSSPFEPMTGPTALVPPLYPYLIALAFKIFGLYTTGAAFAVLTFNSLCSSLTCIPLYFLMRNSVNARVARIVAIAWALYPFAIYFSADRVWDYAVTSLLFTCCLVLAQKLHLRGPIAWAGFGLLYGVAVLSNPSIATLLPFFLLIAIWKLFRGGKPWLVRGALACTMFAVAISPWMVRNHRVMHADFFLRDGFWLEAYAGNNGDTHESNSAFAHPASNPVEMQKYQQMGEIRYMAEKRSLTLAFARRHPGFVAIATLRRIVRFWTGYWSFAPQYLKYEPFDLPNVPFCLVLLFFTIKGMQRWWKRDRTQALPYLIALLIFPVPYYLTHASMDYRQPLEPILTVLVSMGIFGLSPVWARKRQGVPAAVVVPAPASEDEVDDREPLLA